METDTATLEGNLAIKATHTAHSLAFLTDKNAVSIYCCHRNTKPEALTHLREMNGGEEQRRPARQEAKMKMEVWGKCGRRG